MKKNLYIFFILFMLLLIPSCREETEVTQTPTQGSAYITEISCSGYLNDYAYHNQEYIPSNNVIVKAKYSNGITKNVTSQSIFTCDTSKVGKTEVLVKYESFTYSYNIQVRALRLMFITVDSYKNDLTHNTGDQFRINDIIVKAHFENGTVQEVFDITYYFIHEGNKKVFLNTPGDYVAVIQYIYNNEKYQAEIGFKVNGDPLPYTYQYIDVDTTYVKKVYYEDEVLNLNNLLVKGMLTSLDAEYIQEDQYDIELYKGDNLVTEFLTNGEYRVKIIYKGSIKCEKSNEAYFTVEYREINPDLMTIHFSYSYSNIEGYEVRVKKGSSINPFDYLVIPEGYAFVGFEKYDWSNLSEDTNYVINLDVPAAGKTIVAFLNNDYTLFYKMEYVKNISIQIPLANPKYIGEDEATFVAWDFQDNMFAETSRYIMPIFENKQQYVVPYVSLLANNQVEVYIPNNYSNVKTVKIMLCDIQGNVITEINDNHALFKSLSLTKEYLIKGYLIAVGKTGEVKVNIIPQKFNCSLFTKTQESLTYESLLIGSDSIIIDPSYFNKEIDNYELDGFVVKDFENNIVNEVNYFEYDYRLTIDGLEKYKDYSLYIRYKDSDGNVVLIYYFDFQTFDFELLE